jgi:hypothetical protein
MLLRGRDPAGGGRSSDNWALTFSAHTSGLLAASMAAFSKSIHRSNQLSQMIDSKQLRWINFRSSGCQLLPTAHTAFPEFGVCLDVICIPWVAFHAGSAFC